MSTQERYERERARVQAEMAEAEQAAFENLFGHPERPSLPSVDAEQRALPFPKSVAGDFHRWRQTPEAEAVLDTMRTIARRWLLARPGRKVGARSLWEAGRREWLESGRGPWPDNRLQPDACRVLEDTTPDLRGWLRFRVRTDAA